MAEMNPEPAFPGAVDCTAPQGMSMRDWLAGSCDVSVYRPADAFLRANGREPTIGELAGYIAEIRYCAADAMLAERSK